MRNRVSLQSTGVQFGHCGDGWMSNSIPISEPAYISSLAKLGLASLTPYSYEPLLGSWDEDNYIGKGHYIQLVVCEVRSMRFAHSET